MTKNTATEIERKFRGAAVIRISKKKRGDSNYTNDAGYWDGGRCNYGGAHNLREDCEHLGSFFAGITELKNVRKDLTNFTNRAEFEKNKRELLTKCERALDGLKMQTGTSTSIGGVCIIWADFREQFEKIINDFRKDLEMLKTDIERVPYNEAKELQKLLVEEKNLKNEIEENERKARNETDPDKKRKFIFLADEAKEKLKKTLERRKQLKTGRLGDDFDPNKHIDDFLKELEEKLTPKNRPPRPPHNPHNPNNPPADPNNPDNVNLPPNAPYSNPNSTYHNEQKPFLEKYWRELLLGAGFLLTFYYISNQKDGHG